MTRRVLAALAVLALVAAACGESEPAANGPSLSSSTTAAVSTIPGSPSTSVPSPVTATSEAPTPTTASLRSISEEEPLIVWAIGDSFLELFGPALVNRSADTGMIETEVDFRYVSGLSRPDFFDWPAHIAEKVPEIVPDAVVVMFGGNDAQDVEFGGERFDVGTQAWADLYDLRVAEAMDVLVTGVDRVYWIGLPIMKSDRFTINARTMNAAYESAAAQRPAVTYISSFELFQDDNGSYNAYLDGKLMRFTDGAHFVWNGAYRLADAVLPVIAADWGIDLAS
ncbi:MAG: DUF459 domain-containing protein [Acidimicrobiia bacterium]|nr:DUF459 domain-containing protein [Acidimicrobiia bacterium]